MTHVVHLNSKFIVGMCIFTMFIILEFLGATLPKILATAGGMSPNSMLACMQACASPHYNSTQDTLLSNFDFLHYPQIMHCLKVQWWAFGPPLLASGPILHASVGPDDLGGCGIFFLFYQTQLPETYEGRPLTIQVKKTPIEIQF